MSPLAKAASVTRLASPKNAPNMNCSCSRDCCRASSRNSVTGAEKSACPSSTRSQYCTGRGSSTASANVGRRPGTLHEATASCVPASCATQAPLASR